MTLINTYLKIFIFLAQVHRPFRGLSSCHIEGSPFYRRNPTTSIKYVSASLNHTNNLQYSIKLCKSMYKNLCRYHIRESMVIYSTQKPIPVFNARGEQEYSYSFWTGCLVNKGKYHEKMKEQISLFRRVFWQFHFIIVHGDRSCKNGLLIKETQEDE